MILSLDFMKQEMMTSAGSYANHLHLAADRRPCQQLIAQFFMDQLLLLTSSQQCQGTEGIRMLTVGSLLSYAIQQRTCDNLPFYPGDSQMLSTGEGMKVEKLNKD